MEKTFCRTCALAAFKLWKGWPSRDARSWPKQQQKIAYLPDLPICEPNGACPKCGNRQTLKAAHVFYKNIHEEFNTGLPDYFVLTIIEDDQSNFLKRFGKPYTEEPLETVSIESIEEFVRSLFPYAY